MKLDYQKILAAALKAALKAGKYLKDTFAERPEIEYKGDIDLVTERDRKSQQIICDIIGSEFPQHSILAEENLEIKKDEELLWLIDPLDGTTNYAHALPFFCVSIAFLKQGETKAAVVYNPILEESFQASKGGGTFLNGKKIQVTGEKDLQKSLLATGFPYDIIKEQEKVVHIFKELLCQARGLRRCGSAALDLAYTAAGRFDGFWEMNLAPWDTAAGRLLVEEAGGRVSDFSGNPFDPFKKECLASNGLIHQRLLEIITRRSTWGDGVPSL